MRSTQPAPGFFCQEKINNLAQDQQAKFNKILSDLTYLSNLFVEEGGISQYVFTSWADMLSSEHSIDVSMLLSNTHHLLNSATRKANNGMDIIYIGFNCLALLLSIAAMGHWDLGDLSSDKTSSISGTSWNGLDTLGGAVLGLQQFAQGERTMGMINFTGSVQLAASTIIANLAKYTPLIHLSHAAIGGLMGFSFAACMAVSGCVEVVAAHQCSTRIKVLEKKLTGLRKSLDQVQNDDVEEVKVKDKCLSLQKIILFEKAKRENHKRSALAWGACAIGMTAVATISYITLSGLTFGVLPAVTVAVAAVATLSGVARTAWVKHKDHVENLKTSLKNDQLNALNVSLKRCKDKKFLSPDETVTIGLFNKKTTLRTYLEEMMIHNPTKFQTLLRILQDASLTKENFCLAFKSALSTHRRCCLFGGVGATTGSRIMNPFETSNLRQLKV